MNYKDKIYRSVKKIDNLFYKLKYTINNTSNIILDQKGHSFDNYNLIMENINLIDFFKEIDPDFLDYLNLSQISQLNRTITSKNYKNLQVFSNGFQSWTLSTELNVKDKINYKSLFNKLNPYIIRDKTEKKFFNNHIISHFFIYFKNKPLNELNKIKIPQTFLGYIFIISKNHNTSPVTFYLNQKNLNLTIELYYDDKDFNNNESISELFVFYAKDFFDLKLKLNTIFKKENLININNNKNRENYINNNIEINKENNIKKNNITNNENQNQNQFIEIVKSKLWGWESWYCHYTNINQEIIFKNLESLYKIKNQLIDKNIREITNFSDIDKNSNSLNKKKSNKNIFLNSINKNTTSIKNNTSNKISLNPVTIKVLKSILENNFVFQIDDGWEKVIGDWEINKNKFSITMDNIADKIYKAGFIPGLWIAPFLVTKKSKIFKNNFDWILKDKNKKPIIAGYNPNWNGDFYCLDLSHPDVVNFITNLFDKIVNKWGFQFLKLDFLYTGLFSGNFYKKSSAYENYNKIMDIITSFKKNKYNKNIILLGCGAPFENSFKYFDYMRIGADTKEIWEDTLTKFINYSGRPSTYNNIINTIELSFLNNTIFLNDPDVFFLRDKNIKLTYKEKRLIFLTNFLTSNVMMFSDDLFENKNRFLLKELDLFFTDLYNFYLSNNFPMEFGILKFKKDNYLIYDNNYYIKGKIDLKKHDINLYLDNH